MPRGFPSPCQALSLVCSTTRNKTKQNPRRNHPKFKAWGRGLTDERGHSVGDRTEVAGGMEAALATVCSQPSPASPKLKCMSEVLLSRKLESAEVILGTT